MFNYSAHPTPAAATPHRAHDLTWDRVIFLPPGLDKSHAIFDPPPYRSLIALPLTRPPQRPKRSRT